MVQPVSELPTEENKFKLLQKVFDSNSSLGIVLLDSNLKLVIVNKAAKEMSLDLVLTNQKEILDNNLEVDFEPREILQKVLKRKKELPNLFIKTKTTLPKTISLNFAPFFNNQEVIGVIVRAEDVTHFIKQQQQLQEAFLEVTREKDRWQALFGTVEEGIFTVDRDFKITRFNDTSVILSGFSRAEAVGESYDKIFSCQNKHGIIPLGLSSINKVFITKEAVPYDEHIHTTKDGRDYWVGLSHTPIFNKEGEVEECITVMRDISRLKELEKARTEFVSIASHELRTPLTIINGYLDLLLSGQLGEFGDNSKREFHKSLVHKVYKESKRLKNLVDELLNVSLIEGGKMRLRQRRVKIDKLMEEVISEMKPLAASKNLNLNLELLNQNHYIFADSLKLKQVLTNLLDNAFKFTETGGNVSVKGFAQDGHFIVQVTDTGIGIPQRLLPNIFEKFQQVSGSYLKENKGTGLGLFIVKGIIELHGGKISANSKLGKGTTITFSLPLDKSG